MPLKRAAVVHDWVNLVIIPILGSLTVLGLLDVVDPVKVTIAFIWYVIADTAWLIIEPEAVPSLPSLILIHHFVTFILLCFPLKYTHLAYYTCWDGMCEINTFFLIAKRQWKATRRLFGWLYWITFPPLRTILYPIMLVKFWEEMTPHATWEKFAVCGSQVILIAFNFILLSLSVANLKKKRGEKRGEKGRRRGNAKGGGMAVEGDAVAIVTIDKNNSNSGGAVIAVNTRSRSKSNKIA